MCPTCGRPRSTCLCVWVRPTANTLPVLLLQHPLEVKQAKGSARLLALSLVRCRLEVGEAFEAHALADWLAELGPTPVLLYPDTPALPPGGLLTQDGVAPSGLVVIDATWRKSLRMLHLSPALLALPRHALAAPPPSRYAIRVAPREEQRSTLEATCLALGVLEKGLDGGGPPRYEPLLSAFDGFVAQVGLRPT